MIPNNLKGSRCYCAALSLPVMGKEEMRRVPKLPGSLAEELAALPRVPVDGHEMYSADAVQPVDRCVLCGDPVEDGRSIHIECIPF